MKKTIIILVLLLMSCNFLINKMAFYPEKEKEGMPLPERIKEIFIETEDKENLQCYLIEDVANRSILIYFHGNAGNLSHRLPDLLKIHSMGINVLGVSYRGYGKSSGRPSEKGIYNDGSAALSYIKNSYNSQDIYVLGRSIGSTVATHIAQNQDIAGLLLISPLLSGKEQAKRQGLSIISFLAGESFDNKSKINRVNCPVLIIHGTQDEVISFSQGAELFKRYKGKKSFIKIEGAGHNNISSFDTYWKAIKGFLKAL